MLEVFVQEGCEPCTHARELARRAAQEFPAICVAVIDIDQSAVSPPPEVFAVPSFLLDGQVLSLGNPSWERLAAALERSMEVCHGHR